MSSENDLQRTVVLVKPNAPESVLKAVKDLADTHDFVILTETQRVLSGGEARELAEVGLSREFVSGPCSIMVIERINGLAIWQKACTAAGMDEAAGVFSPTPEHHARALATLFPQPLAVQRTFAMIKPDAVRLNQTEQIIAEIQRHGFTVIARQKLTITRPQGEEFYAELKGLTNRKTGQLILPPLLDFMTSGPVVALVLAKPAAIRSWRRLIGPTDPEIARSTKPNCLRARFGEGKLPANACHGSDENPGSVAREVKFFFPNLPLEVMPEPAHVKAALMSKPEAAGSLSVLFELNYELNV
jgi:nucleoside-diphosphate kinase